VLCGRRRLLLLLLLLLRDHPRITANPNHKPITYAVT
jgi:hypothetical protein